MAKTLSLIKSLYQSYNQPYYFFGFKLKRNPFSDYLLTPEDFELLKNLPVTSVDLEALDLTKDNIKIFRKTMKQMKIREIDFEEELYQNKEFEINIERFGPSDIYRTIKDIS